MGGKWGGYSQAIEHSHRWKPQWGSLNFIQKAMAEMENFKEENGNLEKIDIIILTA